MPNRIVISKIGGPEVLEYIDYQIPKKIEKNSVRIKQNSIGLNYIDTYHRSGIYPLPFSLPICPGLEAAGEVIKVGTGVKNFKVGDRVSYAGAPLGSYSTHRNYPTKNLVKVPDSISFKVAATLMTKGLTTF